MLSYSNILTVTKTTDITGELLSDKLLASYGYYLNENKFAQPGLLLIQRHSDNNKNENNPAISHVFQALNTLPLTPSSSSFTADIFFPPPSTLKLQVVIGSSLTLVLFTSPLATAQSVLKPTLPSLSLPNASTNTFLRSVKESGGRKKTYTAVLAKKNRGKVGSGAI